MSFNRFLLYDKYHICIQHNKKNPNVFAPEAESLFIPGFDGLALALINDLQACCTAPVLSPYGE